MNPIVPSRAGWALAAAALLAPAAAHAQGLEYPQTRRGEQVDVYHGTSVADPFRWLEDTDSPETRAWITAQNRLTSSYLEAIPQRRRIEQRLTQLWNYERSGTPFKRAGRYFWWKNNGLQNQSVLYTAPSLAATPRVVLDPNRLSQDGTLAVSATSVSEDGKLLGYGVSSGGSDWQELRVRDVATARDLPDRIQWVKFSGISWTHDGRGFFYSRYPQPTGNALTSTVRNQKLYYHRLGTPQSADVLVYERTDQPDWGFGGFVTDDGRYLVVNVTQGTDRRNRVYIKDLGTARTPRLGGEMVKLLDDFDADYSYVGNDGPVFFFQTDLEAPRGRVISIDLRNPARERWRTVVPQAADAMSGVTMAGGRVVAQYMHDVASRVRVFEKSGALVRDIQLPGLGSLGGLSGEPDDPEMFYSFASYLSPSTVYRHNVRTGVSSVLWAPRVAFDASQYETRQLFFQSKDGTRVPMFVTHRKGMALDGNNPTLLYGYGGFNSAMTPGFAASVAVWLEMGGVYAVANIRGGSEYGEEWHAAGTKERKQNVFDDFIGAAEHLIAQKYTSPAKLAISGGSNGGLLVGAVLNQRPELFGAALPAVGVMDMLRFHKFTIGWAWTSDYGSPDDAQLFPSIYAYSPLHNIKPGTRYPAVLVTTGDHDDRVVPGHSFKYAAALQAAQAGPAPVLIRIETRGGHGAGKPTQMQIEEAADRWAFLARNLGMNGSALVR
ncbi:MAG TPA: prolyl oligopeptidase family serine peptidase [Longimicrobium sp.]|jgi:prolyl oligopeptidase